MSRHDSGLEIQFGSGISAVAPLQKEIFFCLYQEFAESVLGIAPSVSAAWVLQGGDARFSFLNYGDDNFLFGEKSYVLAAQEFLGDYLEVVPEDPPRFLGFLWTGRDFRLSPVSYLTKTWLNERAPLTNFRKYPFHGWVEKRRVYKEKGTPEMEQVFAREEELMSRTSLTWVHVRERAQIELATMARSFAFQSERVRTLLATEKDYLLTAEEKLALPGYEGYSPAETSLMIRRIVADRWRNILR